MNYEPVIGLEVHVQLNTASKIFCGCSTTFGASPNTQVCPVCLGLPGVLPVLNEKVLEYASKVGLALGCDIAPFSKFDRKNYFYPDLPKAYQISQFDKPLCLGGKVPITVDDVEKTIQLTRIHLEEDAGKLVHAEDGTSSGVDYNRCGTPLIEIVSEPELSSPAEAAAYMRSLKQLLEYLQVSDCNMQEGSLRCDANISLRPVGSKELGTKAELKNMNSISGVEKALEYEIKRQQAVLEDGGTVVQETRLWDADALKSRSMRSKEEAHDYRYFPEPDLVPICLEKEQIDAWEKDLPELPREREERFKSYYDLSEYDAHVLTASKSLADYFEVCAGLFTNYKVIANWIMGDLSKELNAGGIEIDASCVTPEKLVSLLKMIEAGTISGKIAKDIFPIMFSEGKEPETIVKEKGLVQISDENELLTIVDEVLHNNEKSVEDYKAGKKNVISFLVGQVMKATRGKANPGKVNQILNDKLNS